MDRKSKLLDRVVQTLTQQILDGEYGPGDKLPTEAQLQKQWEVSRSVVREAMKVLASQGLVRVEQGRGTFVAKDDTASLQRQIEWALRRGTPASENAEMWPPDLWDNLLDVRGVLEVAAAERAAVGATESDLEALRRAIDTMRADPANVEVHNESDLAFHRALAGATQNPLWLALLASFNDLLGRYFDLTYHGRDNALQTAAQHEAILTAVSAGDSSAAAVAMRAHLESAREDLVKSRQQKRVPPLHDK